MPTKLAEIGALRSEFDAVKEKQVKHHERSACVHFNVNTAA